MRHLSYPLNHDHVVQGISPQLPFTLPFLSIYSSRHFGVREVSHLAKPLTPSPALSTASMPQIPVTNRRDHTRLLPLTDGSLACDGTGREFAEIEAPVVDMV
jgi:hypothetical protein